MEFEQQLAQEMKSNSVSTSGLEKVSASFDCSICLDFARDPVVTLCGHLYCWPCIYKWLEFQKSSLSSDECSQCPVCKVEISQESVVPLYGRGQSLSELESADETTSLKLIIPPRPTASTRQTQTGSSTLHQRVQSQTPFQNSQNSQSLATNHEEANSLAPTNLGSPMPLCHPMCGNYGEMVYARVFGNSESFYTYPYSYHTQGSMSPRLRRLEIQTSKSLNRISFFIFCCIILCLFLF